jgi:hypothetical protein
MHEEADELTTPRPARFVRPPPPPLARDCALFLDIDGTLAELAQTPDAVRVDEKVAQALPRIARELGGALQREIPPQPPGCGHPVQNKAARMLDRTVGQDTDSRARNGHTESYPPNTED